MTFSDKATQLEIDKEMDKFADSRCDTHLAEHGDYKEMHDYFLQNIGSHLEFIDTMKKSEFKVTKLVENLMYEYPEKVLVRETEHQRIKTEKEAMLKRLDIDKITISEQIDFIKNNKVV